MKEISNDTWTGERTIWFNPGDHLQEFKQINDYYMDAMVHCVGKRVLDLGCGHAFGTLLLSLVADRVDGYDIKFPTSEAMKLPFKAETRLHEVDLEKHTIPEEADVCVAIEFLEHVSNPDFVLENLKVQEIYFTIPCYGDKHNHFHKVEYDEQKAADLIRRHFPNLTYQMVSKRMIGLAKKV